MQSLRVRLSKSASPAWSIAAPPRLAWLTRGIHRRRELLYPIENGVGDFLPPAALKTIAVDFQIGLLDRLNEEVRGTELENKSVAQTVIDTSSDRSKTLAFNYASQALNTSYFLDIIRPPPSEPPAASHESHISYPMLSTIRRQYGGLNQLKSNFSAAALGFISSGWVWFVTDRKGNTAVLPTFGAGTLLVRSRRHIAYPDGVDKRATLGEDRDAWEDSVQSSMDGMVGTSFSGLGTAARLPSYAPLPSGSLETDTASPASDVSTPPPPASPYTPYSGGSLTAKPSAIYADWSEDAAENSPPPDPEGVTDESLVGLTRPLHPLFCVSVHEHAWMGAGLGIWGKEEYLRRFWTVLDWKAVCEHYANVTGSPKT